MFFEGAKALGSTWHLRNANQPKKNPCRFYPAGTLHFSFEVFLVSKNPLQKRASYESSCQFISVPESSSQISGPVTEVNQALLDSGI